LRISPDRDNSFQTSARNIQADPKTWGEIYTSLEMITSFKYRPRIIESSLKVFECNYWYFQLSLGGSYGKIFGNIQRHPNI
jgi:hypothetical protein